MTIRNALVVLAKYPEPGKVKTRLAADLGTQAATAVYRLLLRQTVACALEARRYASIVFAVTPASRLAQFRQEYSGGDRYIPQRVNGQLGLRMHAAFRSQFEAGFQKVVMIGADCPELTASDIAGAFATLSAKEVVLGPSYDGGYYLIGLRSPQARLFSGIEWGTARVLEQTVAKIRNQGLSAELLAERADVDTLADLHRLSTKLPALADFFAGAVRRLERATASMPGLSK